MFNMPLLICNGLHALAKLLINSRVILLGRTASYCDGSLLNCRNDGVEICFIGNIVVKKSYHLFDKRCHSPLYCLARGFISKKIIVLISLKNTKPTSLFLSGSDQFAIFA